MEDSWRAGVKFYVWRRVCLQYGAFPSLSIVSVREETSRASDRSISQAFR